MTSLKTLARNALPSGLRERIDYERGLRLVPRVVNRFCKGNGIEIGAGKAPYGPPGQTTFLDSHTDNAAGTPDADIVSDAARIPVANEVFDFVLSSHCLEHHQNTIRTLVEWKRVLRVGGQIVLILPHGDRTFDKHRDKTTLAHHIEDYEHLGDEPDRSHFEEMKAGLLRLDDYSQVAAMHRASWNADLFDWDHRIEHNAMHFHVWTQNEIVSLLQHLRLQIVFVDEQVPERLDSFVVIARKISGEHH